MKVMQEVVEVPGEGLEGLLGKTITLFCANYIYQGRLVGVNSTCIKLEHAHIVYETGPLDKEHNKNAQPFGSKYWYIQITSIESFGSVK
jgi:hypothetical protein